MPGILLTPAILRKFPGSGRGIFPICPGFYSRLQFSGIFRVLAVRIFLYARDFTPGSNSQEFSGQWWQEFSYMPGILSLAPIPKKFPGSDGRIFSICPGFCSQPQVSEDFRAVASRIFLYARVFVHDDNSQKISGHWWQEFPYMPGFSEFISTISAFNQLRTIPS